MKTLYQILILCMIFTSTFNAQNSFVGTWEYQDGNEIFRVELFMNENERIRGHYSKILNNNELEIILYKSNYDLGHGLQNGPAIYGSSNGNSLTAFVEDATNTNNGNFSLLSGRLKMEITTSNPSTATWKVKPINDLRPENDLRELSFPTDIILTKVE